MPEPPVQYDYKPTLPPKIVWVPWTNVGNICSNDLAEACSATDGLGDWWEIIPQGQTAWWTNCAIRHENGHVNGWPKDHPGARYL